MTEVIRRCHICGKDIFDVCYQDPHTVRACGPVCAAQLARKEFPEFAKHWNPTDVKEPVDG